MTHALRIEEHELPAAGLGSRRSIRVMRYGSPAGGKTAYIQAGLHADEPPGFLVMHHLIQRLDAAAKAGKIGGQILLVPVANPIGLAQWRDEMIQGRFDFWNNVNFNRQYADITDRIADRIRDRLSSTAGENIALIRETAGQVLGQMQPHDEAEHMKHLLLGLALEADIVLDLHCDYQSVVHVYMGTSLWPDAADLPAQVGAEATLLADDSGVTPFDEACGRIWWQLAERFPEFPIPPACLAATVELRGITDVSHALAAGDADNIFYFLQRRGFIEGRAPGLPELINPATPLTGVAHVKADRPGVVVFFKKAGDRLTEGELIAEIVNPLATESKERVHPVISPIQGVLFARNVDHYARPGRILAKIAGAEPLKKEGQNLLTS